MINPTRTYAPQDKALVENTVYFKNMAEAHGQNVVKCVEQILTYMDYLEIGYKHVIGLLQLHKAYGSYGLSLQVYI